MYRLKEVGILTFTYVVQNLTPFGHHPVKHTAGLWKHETRKTIFILCVNNCGIKYHSKEDEENLLQTLTYNYKITAN